MGARSGPRKNAKFKDLTPSGIEEQARVTVRFLRRKMDEYENLKREIALLQEEAGAAGVFSSQDCQTG